MAEDVKMTPDPEVPPPKGEQFEAALQVARPGLAAPVEWLGDGWNFYVYAAGDCVLRFPKRAWIVPTMLPESRLTTAIVSRFELPISVTRVHEDGPNDLPFSSHALVAGVPSGNGLSLPAVEALGRFAKALHGVPLDVAIDAGIPVQDGETVRAKQEGLYDEVTRRVLPLVSTEARTYLQSTFETYLANAANFSFRPSVLHGDLNGRNLLVDPASRHLSGVIDFGNAHIGDPAFDLADALAGDLMSYQSRRAFTALEASYGQPLAPIRERARYYASLWPLYRILEGLKNDDPSFTEDGVRMVNANALGQRYP